MATATLELPDEFGPVEGGGSLLRRREPLLLAAITGVVGVVILAVTPPAGDAPAHLYRSLLFDRGVYVWDNLWYSGHYPFTSYSLLYQPVAAALGDLALALSCAAAAGLFATMAIEAWGEPARWSARAFAVSALTPLLSGTYSYAVALAALLGTVWLLERRRFWLAAVGAGITLALSPLAFVFLVLLLGAMVLADRARRPRLLRFGVTLTALAAGQMAIFAVFPSPGFYPYSGWQLALALVVCTVGAVLSVQASTRGLAVFFGCWAVANVAAFIVPSAVGSNMLRLRAAVFPLILLAAALARFRPRLLVLGALALGFAYSVGPQVMAVDAMVEDRAEAEEEYWAEAIDFLEARWEPGYRLEVVPTRGHWEVYWFPRADLPLARGWYRQLDLVVNEDLYEDPLTVARYRAWLDRTAVRFVVVPDAQLDQFGAEREAEIVASPRLGLRPVYRSESFTIYEVPDPRPLLRGAEGTRLTAVEHNRVAGFLPEAGSYRLQIRYTSHWRSEHPGLCISATGDGMTRIDTGRAGPFAITVTESPTELVEGSDRSACGP